MVNHLLGHATIDADVLTCDKADFIVSLFSDTTGLLYHVAVLLMRYIPAVARAAAAMYFQ